MAHNSTPHLTNKGLWSISIGHYSNEGKRTQKKFWLGKDEAQASSIAKALHLAWDNETTVDGDQKKVWSQESIDKAYAFAGAEKKTTPKPQPQPSVTADKPSPPAYPKTK